MVCVPWSPNQHSLQRYSDANVGPMKKNVTRSRFNLQLTTTYVGHIRSCKFRQNSPTFFSQYQGDLWSYLLMQLEGADSELKPPISIIVMSDISMITNVHDLLVES